ncbi:mechanosensitive ion channel family protein [Phycicoccus sp. MAQZ13P-2]|uniref:mechanosensitive ion channel family protein n=1 Tax=Phycicoccus mangrovi TaxID=2840470 RepID=UPI001C0065B8|nr:mechanosensitive ion channel family protein [Phycicoccus mangrovi]MBT9255769.1 mechanosensitive ion channel family protein [Phycicoccus mangrovi]MBT9274363.1 mechanosensitive ion channel family protein [Phycicoccus mangrovi]
MPVTDLLSLLDAATPTAEEVSTYWDKLQEWALTNGVKIVLVLVLGFVARWAAHRLIGRVVATMTSRTASRLATSGGAGRVLANATGIANERHRQRVETMGSLLRSISTFVLAIITALTVMALLGLPLGPLLASAGVGGVAIGFGAQSLVKDFLSGIFMILEDQYGVGDVIDTGEAIGTVEEVTLRVTRLRDANGVTWYVRNGEVIRIGNLSQGYAAAWIDMPVSYLEPIEKVLDVVRRTTEDFGNDPEWEPKITEPPTVLGVDAITGQTVTVRVLVKCLPGENFGVQRELRLRLKDAFDAAGIQGPPLPPFATGAHS